VDEAREIFPANLELAVELEDPSTETLARKQGVPDERAAELLAEGRSLRIETGRDLSRGIARIG